MHTVENLHIYDRHIDNANILLNRNGSSIQPKLILNPDKKDFYSFNVNDFMLVNFICDYPQLKFELAI